MREVFSNAEACHVWASRTQCGRSSSGSIYFDRASIYSYGTHCRMAQFVTSAEGVVACLVNPDSYSVTTSKHQSMVRRVIPSYVRRFDAPNAERNDEAVREYHEQAAETAWRKAAKARGRGPQYIDEAREHVDEFNAYATFFGLSARLTMPADAAEAMARAKARAEEEERRNAAVRAEMAEERRIAMQLRDAEDAVLLAKWIKGDPVQPPYMSDGFARLRVKGDEIETSQGASVPVSVAPMLWGHVQRARREQSDADYRQLAAPVSIGRYELRTIHANGDVTIGCHELRYAELARIAGLLGLA